MTDPSPSGSPAVPEPPAPLVSDERRELYRRQMLSSIGGWSGTVIAAIPTVVFVVVNAAAKNLRLAVIAPIATAVLLALYRMARKQPVQQALGSVLGVVVAAAVAGGTGQAKGYFLLGIITSFVYGGAFLLSIAVRRPVVGLAWEFLDPTSVPSDPQPWQRRRPLLRAYDLATLGGVIVFAARGIVQLTLYNSNATGWLAFARIAMGYPLYIAAVGAGFWIVTRARHRIGHVRSESPA